MTQTPADIAGQIRIVLEAAGDRVGAVRIASTRPVQAARIFEGKTPDEVSATIGRIFSLCGTAQTVAALRAAEAALGIAPAAGVEAARDLLRLAEMFTQTIMRLALHWPRALGLELRPDLVRAAMAAEHGLEAQIGGAGWRRPGAGVGAAPATARGLIAGLEALPVRALVAALDTALAARGISGFGALPDGQSPELGAFTRHWDAPAVTDRRSRFGAGLAARLAASGEDLLSLPAKMDTALAAVGETGPRPASRDSGAGEAIVETARGPLIHRVEITAGLVSRCETDAPTEANFASSGPVAAGLAGAPLDAVAAELHVLAIDPCVACTVTFAKA